MGLFEELGETRRRILAAVKERSAASVSDVARALGVTHEAARKQIAELQRSGWLTTTCAEEEDDERGAGRPPAQYCLTRAAENLFPKRYDALAAELLDRFGDEALVAITDSVVQRLRERGPRDVYVDGDPYTAVEQRGDDMVIIERNCPFIDVAMERPAICSTTVSALRRFTGREVVRERRFQDGDGRCEFHVRGKVRARHPRFELEPPRSDAKR